MKVKKYLKPEKEADGRGPHKHYAQDPREPRRAKRHICQNCPDDVFRVHNRNKHHFCKIQLEDQSPYFIYIVVSISDNLSDQLLMPKFSQVITMSNKN